MRINSVSVVLLILVFTVNSMISGCSSNKARVQIYDKYYTSNQKTGLVAGLNKIEDNRPNDQKERDQIYEKPLAVIINEHLYKSLKLSGIFEKVLFENFDNDKVDVVLTPYLNNFFYETKADGNTAAALGMSLIPFVGLAYNLAGGPSGEHYALVDIDLKMTTVKGVELASGSAKKELSLPSNLHNENTDGVGMLEGRALGEATYELLVNLSSNLDSKIQPLYKSTKVGNCGSDKDCKGDRICEEGQCVNPEKKNKQRSILEAK